MKNFIQPREITYPGTSASRADTATIALNALHLAGLDDVEHAVGALSDAGQAGGGAGQEEDLGEELHDGELSCGYFKGLCGRW